MPTSASGGRARPRIASRGAELCSLVCYMTLAHDAAFSAFVGASGYLLPPIAAQCCRLVRFIRSD